MRWVREAPEMPPAAQFPGKLRSAPFRGRDVVAEGLLTRRQLARPGWRRLLPDIYVHRDLVMDHTAWCKAAGLLLPEGGAISGASAAFLYGADVLSLDAPVHVSVPRDTRITGHPRLRTKRTRLDPGDVRKIGACCWCCAASPARPCSTRFTTAACSWRDSTWRTSARGSRPA